MMQKMLAERNLPPLLRREEMRDILQREVYGFLPEKPDRVSWTVEENVIKKFCAGKAVLNKITITCQLGEKTFSFPCCLALPTAEGKHPFFVHINFRDAVPDRYMPTEELIDNGFAVFSFCYQDVTGDNGDFSDGLAGVLYGDRERKAEDAGKLAMWAWAAHRVMDYAQALTDHLDMTRAIVCGHSRLGKTALLAAATDERFTFAYSNDSGCAGAAVTRNKKGETVKNICDKFPYWFCENYKQYADREEEMPLDQHYLLAGIAPRRVLVGSASEDNWADPVSEQLCCMAASPAFARGFVCDPVPAQIGDEFFAGDIGYHLRKGMHYFSREDWQKLMKFVNIHSA